MMGESMRRGDAVVGPAVTANDRWKKGWDGWVRRSTVTALVAHGVVFLVWPAWEISSRLIPQRQEFVQLEWVSTAGSMSDPGGVTPMAAETVEEVEPELDQGGAGIDVESADLMEIYGDYLPVTGYPVPGTAYHHPTAGYYRRAATLQSAELKLERLESVSPELAALAPSVVWPVIRNPSVIDRFIRTRTARANRATDEAAMVSVAMWINERGMVEWASVRESSGHSLLDQIAVDVFKDIVVFTPPRSLGSPIPLAVVISILF